jgi:hypothetical protein
MKALTFTLFLSMISVSGSNISEYHEDFRFLLTHSEKLMEMPKTLSVIIPTLDSEIEIFAAENVSASCELLYTSTYMLLQQHATLVEIYVQTSSFKDSYIKPSIQLLLNNCLKIRAKNKKYLKVVRQPQIFQQILNLDEIAKDIETRLRKYDPAPQPTRPAEESPTSAK